MFLRPIGQILPLRGRERARGIARGADNGYNCPMGLGKAFPPLAGAVVVFLLILAPLCARAETPGSRAPDFTLKDLAGNYTSLTAHRGRVVLLHFWATWCAPCKDEIPLLDSLQKKYSQQGLSVLALASDSGEEAVREFLGETPVTYRVIHDRGAKVARSYGVLPIPVTFLINRQGVIVKRYAGGRDWLSPEITGEIERLLSAKDEGSALTPASRPVPPFVFPGKGK